MHSVTTKQLMDAGRWVSHTGIWGNEAIIFRWRTNANVYAKSHILVLSQKEVDGQLLYNCQIQYDGRGIDSEQLALFTYRQIGDGDLRSVLQTAFMQICYQVNMFVEHYGWTHSLRELAEQRTKQSEPNPFDLQLEDIKRVVRWSFKRKNTIRADTCHIRGQLSGVPRFTALLIYDDDSNTYTARITPDETGMTSVHAIQLDRSIPGDRRDYAIDWFLITIVEVLNEMPKDSTPEPLSDEQSSLVKFINRTHLEIMNDMESTTT